VYENVYRCAVNVYVIYSLLCFLHSDSDFASDPDGIRNPVTANPEPIIPHPDRLSRAHRLCYNSNYVRAPAAGWIRDRGCPLRFVVSG
jgi:hypothetical protein